MKLFDLGKRPLVMGIINVTPDSFSGDGVMRVDEALALATRMIEEGADILDVGGESSRPGATPISAEEEMRRVVPVIAAIAKLNMPIAIDTVKASVAAAALEAGAAIVNDISAMQDAAMPALIAKSGAHIVLMHNRGAGKTPDYDDIVEDVAVDLGARIKAAHKAGIAPEKIIADPGLGFGKTPEQNCALINHLGRLKATLDCAMLIGPSRKSFIGKMLDVTVDERLEGTAAAVAAGVLRGADIVRVHDVKFMSRIVKMTQAIAES